jgi:hypothetical protein
MSRTLRFLTTLTASFVAFHAFTLWVSPCAGALPGGPEQSSSGPGPDTSLMIDLTDAIVVSPATLSRRENKAVGVLVEEVELRTGRRWGVQETWPSENRPVVVVGSTTARPGRALAFSAWGGGRKTASRGVPDPH